MGLKLFIYKERTCRASPQTSNPSIQSSRSSANRKKNMNCVTRCRWVYIPNGLNEYNFSDIEIHLLIGLTTSIQESRDSEFNRKPAAKWNGGGFFLPFVFGHGGKRPSPFPFCWKIKLTVPLTIKNSDQWGPGVQRYAKISKDKCCHLVLIGLRLCF